MHTTHLNRTLQIISCHLGLANAVMSRTFQTLLAFKGILDGSIPAWHLAVQMGHFSSNKHLLEKVYRLTCVHNDTRQISASDTGATVSDSVRQALNTSSAVMPLPDPADVDPEMLQRAQSLLEAFHQHLEQEDKGKCTDIPAPISDGIVETFQLINSSI